MTWLNALLPSEERPNPRRERTETLRDAPRPEALVLAVRVEGLLRAYPFETLEEAFEVVQETLGNTPVSAFYTPFPQTAAAFDRRIGGVTLNFARVAGQPGLFQDRETGSLWTIQGACLSGPWQGNHLARVFSLQVEWYGWSSCFPETTIYTACAAQNDAFD